MNYNVTICALCPEYLTLQDVQDSVYWLPECPWGLQSLFTFDLVADYKFAHKRCWKALSERRRRNIRQCCERKFEPRTQGASL